MLQATNAKHVYSVWPTPRIISIRMDDPPKHTSSYKYFLTYLTFRKFLFRPFWLTKYLLKIIFDGSWVLRVVQKNNKTSVCTFRQMIYETFLKVNITKSPISIKTNNPYKQQTRAIIQMKSRKVLIHGQPWVLPCLVPMPCWSLAIVMIAWVPLSRTVVLCRIVGQSHIVSG